jgi:hypothetical protein
MVLCNDDVDICLFLLATKTTNFLLWTPWAGHWAQCGTAFPVEGSRSSLSPSLGKDLIK